MTTFFECVDRAVAGGAIGKQAGDRLKADFRRHKERYGPSGAAAFDRARQDLIGALEAEARHAKRKAKLALEASRRVNANAFAHVGPNGKPDIADGMLSTLEAVGANTTASVAARQGSITGLAHAKMETLLHHFRRGRIGGDKDRHNAADLKNVLREAFGLNTGDVKARQLANAWMETAEWLRQRFNAAGGAIGKLENWGLPQWHDPRALRNAGPKAWKDAIRPLLDLPRMRHPLTRLPVDEAELDGILDEIYLTVTTEGWIDREPVTRAAGRGALANQRAEHRFLVFRDPDAWLGYQEDFGGGGDVFAAMMAHLNGMARDIAAMEVLGPNPGGMIEFMKQRVTKEAQTVASGQPGRLGGTDPAKALDYANKMNDRIDAVWQSISGKLETPINSRFADVMSTTRSLITASTMGSAAISSLSDVGTSMVARHFAGMPAHHAIRDMLTYFSTFKQREAVEAGLILDSALHVLHKQARYAGMLARSRELSGYLADRVLTLTLLTPMTQGSRHAFGLSFMTEAGRYIGRPLADMPDAMRRKFLSWGLTEKDWAAVANTPLHREQLLRPRDMHKVNARVAERYLEMILGETEFAVPSGGHRSKTLLLGQNRPGDLRGEALRTAAQFKSFGVVFLLLHGIRMRGMIGADGRAMALKYAIYLTLATTIWGAVSVQLKQIAGGRDTRDMTTPEFWMAAMLQGGGLGIYGDFLFADLNRYGGGFAGTIGGPLVNRAGNFWNLTAGNVVQLGNGEPAHFGRELVNFMRHNVPGSNIWYLKLVYERTMLDQLQYMIDPEANKAFKRQQQYWGREYGQEYWWKPGELAPG